MSQQNDNLVKFGIVPIFWVGLLAVILIPFSLFFSALLARKTRLAFGDIWLVSICVILAALAAVALWFILGKRGFQTILYATETLMGVDMPFGPTHDGKVGKTFSVEVKEGNRTVYLGGATEEQWRQFVSGMVDGKSTAESGWTGNGKPFDKDSFNAFRDELIARGYGIWNNPDAHSQGWRLTRKGELVMWKSAREMGLSVPPTPPRND